jgi:hypothetical protein
MIQHSTLSMLRTIVACLFLAATGATCKAQPEKNESTRRDTMSIQQRAGDGAVSEVAVTATAIVPGNGVDLSTMADAPGGAPGVLRPYVDLGRNSRLGSTLPATEWKVRWKTPLRPRDAPLHILQSGDRIIAEAAVWQLFDDEGKPIWAQSAGASPLEVDAEHGVIHFIDQNGYLMANSLKDGKEIYSVLPLFGDEYLRPYISRKGNRVTLAGSERQLDPHGHNKASRSMVELIDLGESDELTSTGVRLGATNVSTLFFETTTLAAAAHGESLIVAIPDHLYMISPELKIVSAFDGAFSPIVMSLDEGGRAYMVASTPKGKQLLIVTPEGKLLLEIDLPSDLARMITPPVIGLDHRIYLVTDERIHAFSEKGESLWESRPGVRPGGVTVTADNRVLVSAGSDLCIYDSAGHCTLLQRFEGENLSTPAIISTNGNLLVATEGNLYALEEGKE